MKITAQVVLINPEGLVLGVSRKDNHNDFGLPGGKMEESDASVVMTAIRETLEETGLRVTNLRLIFAIHKGGFMGYTYLADYEGEINHNEPHVVKWVPFNRLIEGSFGRYNKMVAESLTDLGVQFVFEKLDNSCEDELRECLNKYGYIFEALQTTTNWLGLSVLELTFKNGDGSFIDEDFWNKEMMEEIEQIGNKYGVRPQIPSDYFPK